MHATKMSVIAVLSVGLPLVVAAQAPLQELVAFPAGAATVRQPGAVPGTNGRTLDQESS